MIDSAVGRALLQLGRVLHKVIMEVQKSVAKKFLWQHSYTMKMLYFECLNITRLIGVLALVPAALVPIRPTDS